MPIPAATVRDMCGLFTHGGHYITILSTDGKDACILDPSYKEGKYEEEGRQGKAEVHEPFGVLLPGRIDGGLLQPRSGLLPVCKKALICRN